MNNFRATLITIGDELLMGQVVDTNSSWIAQELHKIGIVVHRRTAVGDQEESILSILESAVIATDIVIVTGGLGPTADDITKPALCKFFGCRLVQNQEVLAHVRELFAKKKKPMLRSNEMQADVPDCCTVLFNKVGTAPGMWFEKKKKVIIALPGVPFEMKHIMQEHVLPQLKQKFVGGVVVQHHIVTAGEGESFIAERLKSIEAQLPKHITLAYLPNHGMVRLRLTACGNNEEALRKETTPFQEQIFEALEQWVLAKEDLTLSEVVAKALLHHQLTIAVAESCTGGHLGSSLTDVPGSSQYFVGGMLTYSNQQKHEQLGVPNEHFTTVGAVSEAVAKHMAQAVAERMHAHIGVGITGILGPAGATSEKPVGTVWIGVSFKNETTAKCFHFNGDRKHNKDLTVMNAMLQVLQTIRAHA